MVKSGIPVQIFYVVFGLGILLSIGLIFIVAKSGKYSGITKNIIIWFAVLMIINLANLLFTFVYYEKRKVIKGAKGKQGEKGPRGFPGENIKCGDNLCSSTGSADCPEDEKDADKKCILTGGTKDENGEEKETEDNIKEGQCIFPFVYNYKNQYEPLKETSPDYPKNGEDRMGLPEGGEKKGLCATSLNENRTAKTWGYFVGNSARAKELSSVNTASNRNEAELKKNLKKQAITDVRIASGDTDMEAKCPKGYDRIDGDLNQGAGAYVYLCAKNETTTLGVKGVTALGVVEGNKTCGTIFDNTEKEKENITRLTTNLNKDTNVGQVDAKELYMCVKKEELTEKNLTPEFLTDIKVNEKDDFNIDNNVYKRVNIGKTNMGDLNKDTTGAPVYLYTTTRARVIKPLRAAFYIPSDGSLYFTMGKDGEDVYEYKNEERDLDIDAPKLEKKLLVNLFGKDITKRYGAIAYLNDRLFVFKGKFVTEIDLETQTKKAGYPQKIDNLFPEIPENIDTAYVHPNNRDLYFFKDKLVYRFRPIPSNAGASLGRLVTGYPKNISTEFKGAPDYLDAVFSVPDEKERKYTYIAKATAFKVFNEDNILIQDVNTISLDTRFGLQTNSGFESNETFMNKGNVIEHFYNEDIDEQLPKKPEPEPYKCPKNARKFDLENKECAPTGGNQEAENGTGPSKTFGSTELLRK